METFQTARLLMRPLQLEDEAFYCACYTDPVLMRHIGEPLSRDAALKSFKTTLSNGSKIPVRRLTWVMQEKECSARVGLLAIIFNNTGAEPVSAELGNITLTAFQNRGYTVEALAELVDIVFCTYQLSELYACHRSQNTAVNRVMRKLGFSHDKTDLEDAFQGRWVLSCSRWQAARKKPI
jgi:ribosomal-protein-alanine N-acetyltransferase